MQFQNMFAILKQLPNSFNYPQRENKSIKHYKCHVVVIFFKAAARKILVKNSTF